MAEKRRVTMSFEIQVSDATLALNEAGVQEEIRYQVMLRIRGWVKRWEAGLLAFDDVDVRIEEVTSDRSE